MTDQIVVDDVIDQIVVDEVGDRIVVDGVADQVVIDGVADQIVFDGTPDEIVVSQAGAQGPQGVPGSGGGGSATPGQTAHYIGTWNIGTTYAAGECVRAWDAAHNGWALFRAKTATTGDVPDVTQSTAEWDLLVEPILMWGTEDPNATDASNPHGGGIGAPIGSVYQWVQGSSSITLVFSGVAANFVLGITYNGSWSPVVNHRIGAGNPSGNVDTSRIAERVDGDGDAEARSYAVREGTGLGNADVVCTAQIASAVVGRAYAGSEAIHYLGGSAHVRPTADDTRAWNDVKGDAEFSTDTEGVVQKSPDGTRYRIKVANDGTLSTEIVP